MTAQEILQRELRLRGYQYNSIKTYTSCLNVLLYKLGYNPTLDTIKDFLLTINSRNYHKQLTATLHHYFALVLKTPISLKDLPYPQKQYTLPDRSAKYLHRLPVCAFSLPRNRTASALPCEFYLR